MNTSKVQYVEVDSYRSTYSTAENTDEEIFSTFKCSVAYYSGDIVHKFGSLNDENVSRSYLGMSGPNFAAADFKTGPAALDGIPLPKFLE